jgi:transposase
VLTDGDGVPIGLAVEGANRNDFKMVYETLTSIPVERPMPTPEKLQGMYLDKVRLQAQHEAIQAARQRQETAEFKTQYAQRAGVEGTHAQGIRRCGLRQSRYLGLAKTHLQHLCTAVALNVVRLGEWWRGTPQAKTRCSPFAALRVVAA